MDLVSRDTLIHFAGLLHLHQDLVHFYKYELRNMLPKNNYIMLISVSGVPGSCDSVSTNIFGHVSRYGYMTYETDVSVCPSNSLSSVNRTVSLLAAAFFICIAIAGLAIIIFGVSKYFPQRRFGYTEVELTTTEVELNRNHRSATLI